MAHYTATVSQHSKGNARSVAVPMAWTFSAAFAFAAFVGFIPNPILGPSSLFVTNTAHNLVHLLTAIAFVGVALAGEKISTRFMLAFGVVYGLVGLLGFITLAGASEGHLLGIVHINGADNFLHVGLGIVIAAAGWIALKARAN